MTTDIGYRKLFLSVLFCLLCCVCVRARVHTVICGGCIISVVGLNHLSAEIAGFNPARDIDVCLYIYMLCCPVSEEVFATS
jgi:hypothetical protein